MQEDKKWDNRIIISKVNNGYIVEGDEVVIVVEEGFKEVAAS